ncbi:MULTISPECIES: FadR/GntR family transcriptional regulator [Brevibacillus]|jgi:GntR family transcriptional repressor for pyruvate dehydrogenase complex|uniref:Transcriptional regulator n=1 Tax=Brevibacillus borstelensis AK1 TaxID=1300222 RepID=M8DHX0_9BACL|nr:FadR/GntR family transcriptional regulator [Brevibacillus borstelensis]EMT53123.1 transcriptional regulator [Brevibacillus borstelensis AK1]KKX55487.1 transcriptional regulator [Brevibacillus borstelensis cifa_chp40]MBE5397547.1 FadR family transcriptional regulator [Brevibacillus borstelensis]MCC0564957.1 FadR family transcriptional regulator [Brevibacillus borstelensis]MCM3469187.1 FadR family transcriptional regulator [Brevibacillus borstelensis]
MLDSLQERKVYEGILLQIHQIVQEKNLRPGDKLPSERELSEQLGAGRSSVREALRALELLGLIETRRGEGTFLKHYRHNRLIDILGFFILRDYKTKKDLIEMRQVLELDAVRMACRRATAKHFEEMERILAAAEERIEQGEIPTEEDYQFHRVICRSSRNSILHRIWAPLVEYSDSVRSESLSREGRARSAVNEHRQIMEAIRAGDEEQAVERMRKHLENSKL